MPAAHLSEMVLLEFTAYLGELNQAGLHGQRQLTSRDHQAAVFVRVVRHGHCQGSESGHAQGSAPTAAMLLWCWMPPVKKTRDSRTDQGEAITKLVLVHYGSRQVRKESELLVKYKAWLLY